MSNLLSDASWLMIPQGIKEDIVFTQKPVDGSGNLTFTRASDATRTNSAGVIERTPWNLFTFSEQFDNAAWSKTISGAGIAPIVTPNTSTSPIGTLTADRIQFNRVGTTISDRSILLQNFGSAIIGRPYTFSIYIKANAPSEVGKQLRLIIEQGGAFEQIITINAEWTRYTFFAPSAGATNPNCIIETRGTVTANITVDVLVWGAQLVEGTDAKPYFATTNRQDVPRLDYRNADGSLNSCPRLLLEPQRTNSIRNSSAVGAVAGSPGTLPTNWETATFGGLTRTVVGIGSENGLQYIDLRFNGIATGISALLSFEGANVIAAANGQTWTETFYAKTISAANPPVSYRFFIVQRSSTGVNVGSFDAAFTPTSTLARYAHTITTNQATTAFIQPYFYAFLTNGATYDFTIRIAAPQMERGAYATTFIPTTTAAVSRLGESFIRNNIFTNGFITAAGGTWFIDLSANTPYTRDTSGGGIALNTILDATTTDNGLNIRNTGVAPSLLGIYKVISSANTLLYTTLTDSVKIAIKWNGTTADVFVNGVKQVSATAFTTTAMQFINSSTIDVPRFINQSSLFPVPLTDAQLVDITGGRIYYNPVEAYYAYYLTPEIPSAVITSVNSFF
jgi:hypothetical protein